MQDDGWLVALVCYVFAYNFGTIIFGLADPTRDSLLYPAIAVFGVARVASWLWPMPMRSGLSTAVYIVLPILAAVGVIATLD